MTATHTSEYALFGDSVIKARFANVPGKGSLLVLWGEMRRDSRQTMQAEGGEGRGSERGAIERG